MRRAKAAAAKKGQVYLCGLGVFPPQTATVEVLQAISECDVIFNNLPGIGLSEFLGLFCARRRPVAFRYEQDAVLCADLVMSEVAAGKTVGFVTFGHPLLFGPLSHNIIRVCREKGIALKAFGAVSSMDVALASGGMVFGYSYPGFQVFEMTSASGLAHIEKASNKLPIVVYFADGMGEDGLKSLLKALSARFPSSHRCILFGPTLKLEGADKDGMTLKELGSIVHHKLSQGVLFVPPVEA
jgi:precorrin-2 methylase